jgi:hypothetical protein
MDKFIYEILEQNAINEVHGEILNEEVLLAVATALGIVLSAHFIGLYRARKKLKEKCKNLKNSKQLKTCMIQAEIILLKTERAEITNQRSKCATNKRNPERCKQKLTEMIKDYDIKIKEKELQLKNI